MTKNEKSSHELRFTQKLSLFFFSRTKTTALLWLVIVVFGVLCYTTLLKREGFPTINTPYAFASGTYFVNDPSKVDSQVSQPLIDYLLKQDGVKKVTAQSSSNFYTVIVIYKDNVNAVTRSKQLDAQVKAAKILPAQANFQIKDFKFGFTPRGDNIVISFYGKQQTPTPVLAAQAKEAADFINSKNLSLVKSASIVNPYDKVINPINGQAVIAQKSFDRYGSRVGNQNTFYDSIVIGIQAKPGADNLKLDKEVSAALDELNNNPKFANYNAVISASFAPQVKAQINELQRVLLEGLLAVLIIASLLIAVRASFITVISMVTVILAVNGVLYLIGYSLNTITLFGLILSLSLVVDDTIIMTEAIDASRRKEKDPTEVIKIATGKISRAMIAATLTAALCFAPIAFVGGILGSFVRAIPITIISALLISLLTALIFIPFLARYLLLSKKQLGKSAKKERSAGIEARIARFISAPMYWAKGSTKKLMFVGITAVIIGFSVIGASGALFGKVKFNIFPSAKDSNEISAQITFPSGISIQQAEAITDKVDAIIAKNTNENLVKASYYGQADIQQARMAIELIDYNSRSITAPTIIDNLQKQFDNFKLAKVKIGQTDAGPPASAFAAQINSDINRQGSNKLAKDIEDYLKTQPVKRPNGQTVQITDAAVSNASIYNRNSKSQYIEVTAQYKDTDTTTLLTLTEKAVKDKFTPTVVASYGIPKDSLKFDFGQETENQNNFKTLAIAFPLLLIAIYVLLVIEFRSLFQPFLIFMAIPFSLLGVVLGLYLTNNPFSFFASLGFFALIGLSIKNTILLTDYANQSRRAGMGPVDAAHEALAERFRPLVATSLTAVVSLIPLAILSPFWEGLAVVLIGGLIANTFLVVTVFPYFYLGSEYLRIRFSRKRAIIWLIGIGETIFLSVKVAGPKGVLAGILLAILIILIVEKLIRNRKK